jgi:hypothetical protein
VPLGSDSFGRTLAIRKEAAATVRTLYELYRRQGGKGGSRPDGSTLAPAPLVLWQGQRRHRLRTRAHHHILTNSLHARRIRNRGATHDSQHPAIIDREVWDQLQL